MNMFDILAGRGGGLQRAGQHEQHADPERETALQSAGLMTYDHMQKQPEAFHDEAEAHPSDWCGSMPARCALGEQRTRVVQLGHAFFLDRFDTMTTKPENLARHILPTSATMVGVCMTVISIVKLLHIGPAGMWIDKLLAIDSFTFLASAGFSYFSMRNEALERFEKHADLAFMIGLMGMAICAFLLAFELV